MRFPDRVFDTSREPRTVAELLAAEQAGEHRGLLPFWGHRPRQDGTLGPSCLSQWWLAPSTVDGLVFATAEHRMMWGKARLFGDGAAATAIRAAPDPATAKQLGREVTGYDHDTWVAHRVDIVLDANRAKFGQHPDLADYLTGTGDAVLVEAAPNDAVWGIGLAADDPRFGDPARWPGLNLLGFALMTVRAELAGA